MPNQMVIGIIPDAGKAESLLNNLSEADFKPANTSVIMNDPKARNAIARDAGPFKGATAANLATRLQKAGVAAADAQSYAAAVTRGQVFVAVAAPQGSAPAATEMLQDMSAQMVRTL